MDELLATASENWFWSVMGVIAVIWVIAATIESIVKTSSRERSRREIAAYIAAGTMTPEQGERLLSAGRKKLCD